MSDFKGVSLYTFSQLTSDYRGKCANHGSLQRHGHVDGPNGSYPSRYGPTSRPGRDLANDYPWLSRNYINFLRRKSNPLGLPTGLIFAVEQVPQKVTCASGHTGKE